MTAGLNGAAFGVAIGGAWGHHYWLVGLALLLGIVSVILDDSHA